MNCSRHHTDGELHEGTTPTESMVVLPGLIVKSAYLTATDLAAGIYLIQNQDRPESEWDDLPANVTSDDVVRAIARQRSRRESNRSAIAAHEKALSTALPKSTYLCTGCGEHVSQPGLCEDCWDETVADMLNIAGPIPWRKVLWFCAAMVGVVAALAWGCR